MLQPFGRVRALRDWIEIREETQRSALGTGANLNQFILVVNERAEEASKAPELLQCIRKKTVGSFEITVFRSAVNLAGNFVTQQFVFVTLLRPKHLLDGILERRKPASHGGIGIKLSHAVVQQKRSSGPQTDQRRRTSIAASTGRHLVSPLFTGVRVIPSDGAHRRQILVCLPGKIVPHLATPRI